MTGVMRSDVDSQLSPDLEVPFEMCRCPGHHFFTLATRCSAGRRRPRVNPFFKYLICLIKPFLEQPLFVLLDFSLTHVIPPLRSLRAGQLSYVLFARLIQTIGVKYGSRGWERTRQWLFRCDESGLFEICGREFGERRL